MSIPGDDAARRLRALDPDDAGVLAAELRNAATPAACAAATLAGPLPDTAADIYATVEHLMRLADILGGECG